jgi:hypothetical protein
MTEHTTTDDNELTGRDPRAAELLATWRQLDEQYQQVVIATAGALAAFVRFRRVDPETRRLAMRVLDDPSDTELRALTEHPAGSALSAWLLSLPEYLDNDERQDAAERPDSVDDTAGAKQANSVGVPGDVSRPFRRTSPSS